MKRFRMMLLALPLLALLAGCELEPEDEPLSAQDALDADRRMQADADALLREKSPNDVVPPALVTPQEQ
ncbi:MAG: hypothetical protein AAGI46_06735 [Planctomycetota bacterium]